MESTTYSETAVESANIFKIKKAKTEVKGDVKMSGSCSVNVNVADIAITEAKSGQRLVIPYRYVDEPKTVQPVFGADGYAGTLRYPDGRKCKFKVTFPNGEFARFMDTVVPNVIIARNKARKERKMKEKLDVSTRQNVGYVNPGNTGVVYVPARNPIVPQQQQYTPQPQAETFQRDNEFKGEARLVQTAASSVYPTQPVSYPPISPPPQPPSSMLPPPSIYNPYEIPDAPDVPDDYQGQ